MIIKKPTIIIYSRTADEAVLREICAGIEEEGVLFEITPQHLGTALTLSADACEASMLGVGIGICGSSISLHIKGMNVRQGFDEKTALFSHESPDTITARALGTNAARVIKKLPLRI